MPTSDSIRAGDMRHVITLLKPRSTDDEGNPITDASGAAITYVAVYKNVPAAIDPLRATDVIRSGQTVGQVTIPITIRWMPHVTADMLVQWQQGNYTIQGIINEGERNRKLVLMCLALGNQQ